MKNTIKKAATVVLATMMVGIGAVGTDVEFPLLQNTSITAEAASVGKVSGLTSKTLSNSQIKLSWKKVSGASGYSVCMRKNGKYPQIADVKGTSYTVKNLPNATRENFKVRAYKLVNGKKVYGAYSDNWNTATNPQQVTQLKAESITSSSVKLTWKKIGCTNYRVYQYKSGSWKEIAKVTTNSYTVKNLSSNTSYKFKVRACKQDNKKTSNNHYGKYSAELSVKTKIAVPAQVKNLKATTTETSASLTWSKVSGATSYEVYFTSNPSANTGWKLSQTVKTNSATVKNLSASSNYGFKVRACNSAGKGTYSAVTKAKTTAKLLTQEDIDRLQKELQEYSDKKFLSTDFAKRLEEVIQQGIIEGRHPSGYTIEDCMEEMQKNDTPEGNSWSDLYPILYEPYSPDTQYMMIFWSSDSYEDLLSFFKDQLDYEYKKQDDVYYTVYVENCPNGKTVDSDFKYPPCWVVYLLY